MIDENDSPEIPPDPQCTDEPVESPPPDDPPDPVTLPNILFHALIGQLVPSTLKLAAKINGHPVTLLIDGGSTNNFIHDQLASHLGLTIQPSQHLRVTVGNGESMTCAGLCSQVPLHVDQSTFLVDLLLLPIYGADIVLGVQWLSGLGPITFDYTHLWMVFQHADQRIRFQGVTQPSMHYLIPSNFSKISANGNPQFFQLTIEPKQPRHSLSASDPAAPPQFLTALHALLQHHATIFSTPTGLPPERHVDHRIPLITGASPVNVRPYRYPYFQKSEIEKLVSAMLTEGIIQPSTSPFSFPVLLVKKKMEHGVFV